MNALWTWLQKLLFYVLAKNKTRWSTGTDASFHVRTTVETLETRWIVYLDNKPSHESVCIAKPLLQASPLPPTKNHKNIGFSSKTGPDPLNKITKLPSQPSMLDHHRHASETPYIYRADRWRADDGPLIVVFRSSLVSTLVNLKSQSWTPPPPPPPPPRQDCLDPRIKLKD